MTENTTPLLEIAIPVYNEERRLEAGVRTLHKYCIENKLPVQITIADNGSRDNTIGIATELAKELPNVRLLRVPQKGVGRALKYAWTDSKAPVVGYMDVDLSTDLKHLTEVAYLFLTTKCDVVNGSRLMNGSRVYHRKLIREITSRGFNFMLRAILGVRFSDGMCGFKFLRREAFERISKLGIQNEEWFFNTEILVKSEWAGLEISEVPVVWTDDHDSKAKIFEMIVKFSKEIWRLRLLRGEQRA